MRNKTDEVSLQCALKGKLDDKKPSNSEISFNLLEELFMKSIVLGERMIQHLKRKRWDFEKCFSEDKCSVRG